MPFFMPHLALLPMPLVVLQFVPFVFEKLVMLLQVSNFFIDKEIIIIIFLVEAGKSNFPCFLGWRVLFCGWVAWGAKARERASAKWWCGTRAGARGSLVAQQVCVCADC